MSLKDMVAADKAIIANAKQKLDIARDVFNKEGDKYRTVASPIENRHKYLIDKFIRYVNDEIREDCCDNCRPKLFHKGVFNSDGITIWDEADHPYDIREVDYTWEEIEKILIEIGEWND